MKYVAYVTYDEQNQDWLAAVRFPNYRGDGLDSWSHTCSPSREALDEYVAEVTRLMTEEEDPQVVAVYYPMVDWLPRVGLDEESNDGA